jgi:hypothetical protein
MVLPVQYQIQRTRLTFHVVPGRVMLVSSKPGRVSMPEEAERPQSEQRRSRRAKIVKLLRVRPSEPRDEHFEDLPVSVNASKEGIYFISRRQSYYKGMRVFVTFPFSSQHDPMNCEYVGEIVRVETVPNGKFGVAVHLLMTVNF